jgi:hypothetical protein
VTDTEPTLADIMAEPPKRRRGRPPKTVLTTVDGQTVETEQKPTRRPRKLTGDDMTQMVVGVFDLIAMIRGPHWKVAPEETEEWAKNAADLANRIPARYVKGLIAVNGYTVVAYGLFKIVQPRLVADRLIAVTVAGVQNGTITEEQAEDVLQQSYAAWPGPKR